MYIWTAIDVDDQLKEIRSQTQNISVGFDNPALTLPFHISLKISFCVDDAISPHVIETLLDYFKTLKPFWVDVDGIETENNIVWIRIKENDALCQLHNDLDLILMEKHNVPRHAFDLDFKFHTTLFWGLETEKITQTYTRIKNAPVPKTLAADKLIIGASQSGKVGTYRVTHNIAICDN